ncbi:MAG: hypothetical protein ACTSQE_07335 [Candidatus Heimdallarchaeaceae archaeon]
MADYATKLAEGFSQKVVSLFFERSLVMDVTNQDYEGEVKDKLSKLNILTFEALALKNYTGADMTADDPQESVGVLNTDQQKAYYFKIKSLSKFHSWIKNPEGTLLDNTAKSLKQTMDAFVLAMHSDVAAGHRLGTDYITGTVAVAATTGVVTGSGTTFTADMVGKGFKADGHSEWYRVATYTSGTSITIEDDKDDVTSAYTGGAISATATYIVEANTAVTLTKTNVYGYIAQLGEKLDEAEIPAEDRCLVIPPKVHTLLVQADELIPAVSEAYQEVIKKGYVGDVAGFKVYKSNQVDGDNVDGFNILGLHKSWNTFAMGYVETGIEDLIGNFGQAYKGLTIYGAKVVDERRKAAALILGIV